MNKKIFLSIFTLISFAVLSVQVVFADPPTSPYTQGQTLEPACAPGETNCTVLVGLELVKESTSSPTSPSAAGTNSVAIGEGAEANSYGEVSLGLFPLSPTANNSSAADDDDLAFQIGTGTADGSRDSAFQILKSNNIFLGSQNGANHYQYGEDIVSLSNVSFSLPSGVSDIEFVSQSANAFVESNTGFTVDGDLTSRFEAGDLVFVKPLPNNSTSAPFTIETISYDGGEDETTIILNDTIPATYYGISNFQFEIINSDGSSVSTGNFSINTGSANTVGYQSTILGGSSSLAYSRGVVLGGTKNYTKGGVVGGLDSSANRSGSFAFGKEANANGEYSIALGTNVTAYAYGEISLGSYPTEYTPGATVNTRRPTDRLFNIGNGGGPTTLSDAFTILNNGDVGINDATPDYRFDVEGAESGYLASFFNDGDDAGNYGLQVQAGADDGSGTTYYLNALDGNGDQVGYLANTSGTFAVTDLSDVRTKTNIENRQAGALETLNQLRVVNFNRLQNPDGDKIIGFIAQEVREVFPEAVSENPEGLLGIQKTTFVPLIVKAMQEMYVQLNEQVPLDKNNAFAQIASYLGSAREKIVNGLLRAQNIVTDSLKVNNELCVGDTCITEAELIEILNNRDVQNSNTERISAESSQEGEVLGDSDDNVVLEEVSEEGEAELQESENEEPATVEVEEVVEEETISENEANQEQKDETVVESSEEKEESVE